MQLQGPAQWACLGGSTRCRYAAAGTPQRVGGLRAPRPRRHASLQRPVQASAERSPVVSKAERSQPDVTQSGDQVLERLRAAAAAPGTLNVYGKPISKSEREALKVG
jgi:hypothetical protein